MKKIIIGAVAFTTILGTSSCVPDHMERYTGANSPEECCRKLECKEKRYDGCSKIGSTTINGEKYFKCRCYYDSSIYIFQ